jgi:hypothetical protein
MWRYAPTVSGLSGYPVVAAGRLYVESFSFTGTAMHPSYAGALEAFDANGVTGCSGTPTVCRPLWRTAGKTYASQAPPAVANHTVFVAAFAGPIAAFDANGSIHCSGTPKKCAPIRRTSTASGGGTVGAAPALVVGGNVLYALAGNGSIVAFDATGSTDCSSSVCNPLWSSPPESGLSPTIANGFLYFGGFTGGNWVVVAYGLP